MAESSDGFLDCAPSDEGLYKVLQEHPSWEDYTIPLGLKFQQVKYVRQRGDNGLLALTHWRDGHCGEDHPGTWRLLLKVIGDSIGPLPAGDLEKKVHTNSNWTLPDTVPPGDCHCFTGMKPSPPVSDGMAKFNECISNLKEFYLEDSVIQDDLLEMNPELEYLPLSYVKVKKETDEKEKERPRDPEPVEYDDIISSVARGPKRVLLQGSPGSGKSTTLRKICHDFAKSNLPSEIKVVVRVVLGELEEGSKPTMKDLMQTCISDVHSNLIEEITSFACDHNREGILFLFDGFDELARDLQKKSLVAEILNHKAYPKSSYIITSRPSATAQLPTQAVQQMDRVETQGFTEDKMKQFIQQWFQTRPDTGKKVIEIIMANSKLRDMCRNPLTVLIACTIASEEQMLPDRMTVLLKSLMCLLGNSYLNKKGQDPSIEQWEDLEEQCSSFRELADLALHGFLKGQYIFTDKDSSLPHCPSKLDHMGLFRVTSQKKGGAIVKSYQFFHLIVQEFLSAHALSLKSSEDQTAFWGEHLVKSPIIESRDWWKDRNLSLYADRRFETIFQFYAGLTGLRDGSIQQLLFNTVDTNRGLVLSYNYPVTSERSAVVYESQNEEVAKQLFSRYNSSLTIEYCKQPQQWMWCLQHVSFSSLTIKSLRRVDELVKKVFDTNKDRLEEVHWTELSQKDAGFAVEMTAKCTKLKVLKLSPEWIDLISFTTQSFLNVFNKSTSLQTLSLKKVQLSDMDVETVVGDISGAIQQLKNLSDVTLEKCCDELTRGVVEGLQRKQTPQHQVPSTPECGLWDLVLDTLSESDGSLSLSVETGDDRIEFEEQSLCVKGIEISQKFLVKFLNKSTSLQTLSLEKVQFSDMDVETVVGDISGAIQQLKNLSDVTLENCSDELTRGVVEGLWRKQTPQHQVPSTPECGLWDLVWDTLFESDGSLSLNVNTGHGRIKFKEQSLHVGDEISQKSLVKFLNKSTSLQTLSLKEVQLSDMDVETVVGDISGAIQQLKNLSNVRLKYCCDELTRGVVGGVVVSQCIQKFSFGTTFSERKYSEEVLKSLENIKNSKNPRDFTLILRELPFHYMASIVCGCFQSRTLEKLKIQVTEYTADGVDGELMTRLESAVRDNNTLRVLQQNPPRFSPVSASVAEAMLKGAACNKRLEKMTMTVPDTSELHELVDEVKEVNKKLRLDVKYWPKSPPSKPPQSHQQGDSGPLLPSQEIAPPSTPPKEPDELENDGEKGVSSVTTSELEKEGENEETLSSPVTTSQMEEGEKKEVQSSSEILSRPEEGEEKVLERPHSQPTLPLWSTQAQPFLPMSYRHVFHRPGLSPSLPLRGVPSPSTPPEKQPSLEDVD